MFHNSSRPVLLNSGRCLLRRIVWLIGSYRLGKFPKCRSSAQSVLALAPVFFDFLPLPCNFGLIAIDLTLLVGLFGFLALELIADQCTGAKT
jgi:hypothetical protein